MSYFSQAICSCERGAAQHGWRRLSDVTRDDGQSQSGTWWWPGAGGREPIGRPGVTRIWFLVIASRHFTALFLLHRPARLKTTSQFKKPQPILLLTTGTIYWACIRIETNPKELFVVDLLDSQTWWTWDVCCTKKKKKTFWDLLYLGVAWPHTVKGWWTHECGRKHETNKQIMFFWNLAASYTAKKEEVLCLWITQPRVVVNV